MVNQKHSCQINGPSNWNPLFILQICVAREDTKSAATSLALLSPTVVLHQERWFWRASVGKTQPLHKEKDGEKPQSVSPLLMVWELVCHGRGSQREFFLLR